MGVVEEIVTGVVFRLPGWRLVTSLLLVLLAPAAAVTGDEAGGDWNVLLISIDTLRADRMSAYGYERDTTPFLEELSTDGVLFEKFSYSGGGTLPSHMSMFTSLNPMTHAVYPTKKQVLDSERVTLAEQLKEAGYATAAFTDGGWIRSEFGFGQGFDIYDDEGGHFQSTLPKATAWVQENKDEKFFLFLHTYDVHSDYRAPMPYFCPGDAHLRYVDPDSVAFDGCRFDNCATDLLKYVNTRIRSGDWDSSSAFWEEEIEFISSTYDGCIWYVDNKIKELCDFLKELGIYEKTLIVVTSDHGEEFAEHGMFLHQQSGYQTLAAIPLIIRFPNGDYAGVNVQSAAAIVDIMPTILEYLGLTIHSDAQGVSLLPSIKTGAEVRNEIHMFDVVNTGRWKFFPRQRRLYDLENDPGEQVNVYKQHPELVKTLHMRSRELALADVRAYSQFQATVRQPTQEVTLTEEEIEELRALGYLE